MFQQTNTSRKKVFSYIHGEVMTERAQNTVLVIIHSKARAVFCTCGENETSNQEPLFMFFDVWTIAMGFSFMLHWQCLTSQLFAKLYKLSRWRTVFKVEFFEKTSKKRSGWDFRSASYYCKTKLWSQWQSVVFAIVSFIQ